MSHRNNLEILIKNKNGLISTKEVVEANIPRQYLSIFVKEGKLIRITYGVYKTPNTFDDELYRIQLINQRVIYSHETALFLHGLTDRDPFDWTVTVPFGYNATHLKKNGVNIHTVNKDIYKLGITYLKTVYNRAVKVYDKERTICDIVRNRNNMDISILNDSIKNYLKAKDRNVPLLLRYARKLNVENIIRNYLEILLWRI